MKFISCLLIAGLCAHSVHAESSTSTEESNVAKIQVEHDWSFQRKSWQKYSYSSGLIFKEKKVSDRTDNWIAPLKSTLSENGEFSKKVSIVGTSFANLGLSLYDNCSIDLDFNNSGCFFYTATGRALYPRTVENPNMHMSLPNSDLMAFRGRGIIRSSEVNTKIEDLRAIVTIKDYLDADKNVGNRFHRFHTDQIFAKVKIHFPADDHKIVSFIKKNQMEGVFNPSFATNNQIQIQGTNFKSSLDINTRNKWETFWRLPGKTNLVEVSIGHSGSGGLGLGIANNEWTDIGLLDIEFKSLADLIIEEEDEEINLSQNLVSKVNDIENKPNLSDEELIGLRNLMLKSVNSSTLQENVLASSSLTDLNVLLKKLNAVALMNYHEPKKESDFSYYGWDIKTSALLLSIEFAKKSIKSLEPYCKKVDYTNHKGEVQKVSGITLASFFVGRAISRLNNFKFNEFDNLFKYLNRLNEQGLRYSDISNDKDQISRLRDAVNLLRDSNVLKKSPFGIASAELKFIQNNFGDLNSKGKNLSDVVTLLSNLEANADNIRVEMIKRLRTFQPDNSQVVDFKDLQVKANDLSSQILSLHNDLQGLFGLDTTLIGVTASDTSRKKFIRFIVDVITNYLSVFENISGELSIDQFLSAYKEHHQLKELTDKFKECLPIN